MLFRLLLLFVLVPLVELYLLLKLGALIGAGPTIAIVIVTGVVGGSMARTQGFAVLRRFRESLNAGILPTDPLVDGLFVLTGGLLLLTPGLLTDMVGFLAFLPPTRRLFKKWIKRRFQQILDTNVVYTEYHVDE
ncbi:MAG: hypothetical protein AMJ92_05935 [candidate division Zixibacteria bacterium SM23_81]|nr:MAG: hypothetical protein AMJ92_05935 [candidate division Zixibacteria bacterium SM23_81]